MISEINFITMKFITSHCLVFCKCVVIAGSIPEEDGVKFLSVK